MPKWIKRLFKPWIFVHCVTPSRATWVCRSMKRDGRKAKLAVVGHAYGVKYKE